MEDEWSSDKERWGEGERKGRMDNRKEGLMGR